MSNALYVVLGGAVGAPLRYLIDVWIQERWPSRFPRGTLMVNVIGTFVLGFVAALVAHGVDSSALLAGVGVGLCGALTTYSTFSVEAVRLAEDGHAPTAARYVALSLALGIAACLAGWALGSLPLPR